MKDKIKYLLNESIAKLQANGKLPADISPNIQIESTKDADFGDFASNLALTLAKTAKMKPRDLAELLVEKLPKSDLIKRVEIAGPGFINFWLSDSAFQTIIPEILQAGKKFEQSDLGKGKGVYLEFVSANPTGPLHVGHGRSAAYGACLANVLRAAGYQVHCEYYVNDAGRQMRILALSTWLRYLHELEIDIKFPVKAYQGAYVIEIAKELHQKYADKFKIEQDKLLSAIPKDIDEQENGDAYLDALIAMASDLIGQENFDTINKFGLEAILSDIKDDLSEFGVNYDEWFYESKLSESGLLQEGINLLKDHGYTYERDGALWFKGTSLGDEKDRVLIRANGQTTYFAADVAYHLYKYEHGENVIVDVWGADHHGYISRIKAFLKAVDKDPDKLKVCLVQFAILYRGKEKVSMSTRSGKFVTLRELRYEVGNDATRYFYIMRKPEQHLNFDLELAKSQSAENPIYYIQYAHARICSVWRQLKSGEWEFNQEQGFANLYLLDSSYEKNLMSHLAQYPEIINSAATNYAPHLLAHYLQELANLFHTYYNASKFLVEESPNRNARLCLISAVQQVLESGLKILGLSAPQSM